MGNPGHYIIAAGVVNDPLIPKVKDDLRTIVEYFTHELGYQHALPELMVSPGVDQFRCALSRWFCDPARDPRDPIVLYFSGHGESSVRGDARYLLLSDSSEDALAATAFKAADLR